MSGNVREIPLSDMEEVTRDEFDKVFPPGPFLGTNWSGDVYYYGNATHVGRRIQPLDAPSYGGYRWYIYKR